MKELHFTTVMFKGCNQYSVNPDGKVLYDLYCHLTSRFDNLPLLILRVAVMEIMGIRQLYVQDSDPTKED